ncbi:MAG: magnesium transporter [Ardenticatenaceae bacterium]|nr:magnesium transporter [Ardenticatenaceae bacterium]
MNSSFAITVDETLATLRRFLEAGDMENALALLATLQPPDQAELLDELDDDSQLTLLPALPPEASADILEEMDDERAAELMAALPTETVIRLVEEMEPDELADLLGEFEPEQAAAVLAGLEDGEEIRPLMLHPDDSAGGLMTSEYLALRRRTTATAALQAIRDWQPKTDSFSDLFVIDPQGHLCGVVGLRQLIVAPPNALMHEIMSPDVVAVTVGTDQETCAQLMSRYSLLALPVVNANNGLVGVITIDDVVEVLEAEATEDIQRLGGAQPLDRPYLDTSVWEVARKRIGWLLLLFVTESLTGSVLRIFEREIQAVVALSFFIPLLIGTGGNAGSQTTSTIIRALAVGDVRLRDGLQAFWHELRIGLLLAAGMAAVAYGRALLWGTSADLALSVSVSILAIVVWANSLGALLPLLAFTLNIDPTVVSGPAMSTLVDATGLFIYFTIARLIMGLS